VSRRPRDLPFRPERVFVSIEDSRDWLIRDIRYGSSATADVDVGDDHGPMERRAHRRQASRKRVTMTADEARTLLVAWNQIVGRHTEST
jgi:hypothetical protein